jgi:DNA-binding NarL/FixJ family response regulator
MSAPVRVVVVDDGPLVRTGLRMILGGAPEIELVGEASDGQQGVDVVVRTAPDVVLMDVRMPRMDGLAAHRRLRDLGSRARVLVLTTFDADDLVLAALRQGAAGFLLKDTPPPDLVAAVRRVALGEPMLSPSVTSQLIAAVTAAPVPDRPRERARALLATLTEREREVAEAVGAGMSNAEIARTLHLGVATVKTHVGNVLAKLDATNRVQIARWVHEAGDEHA